MKKEIRLLSLLLLLCALALTGCGKETKVDPTDEAPIQPAEITVEVDSEVEEEYSTQVEEDQVPDEVIDPGFSVDPVEPVVPVEEGWQPTGDMSFARDYPPYWETEDEGEKTMYGNVEVTVVSKIEAEDQEYLPDVSTDLLYWTDVVGAFVTDGYYTHVKVEDYPTFQIITLYDKKTGFDCTVTAYKCNLYGDDSTTAIPAVEDEFEMSKQIANNEVEGVTGTQYLNPTIKDNVVICNIDEDINWKFSAKNRNLMFEATTFGREDDQAYNDVMLEICNHTVTVFTNIQ